MRGLDRVAADRRHLIAGQVRCSTGYTQGRVQDGAAVLRPLGVAERQAVPPRPPATSGPAESVAAQRTAHAEALLAVLRDWPEGEPLAGPVEMARRAGIAGETTSHSAHRISQAFEALEARRAVLVIRGTGQSWRGERMVLLRGEGRVLATAGAPDFWATRLREMAHG